MEARTFKFTKPLPKFPREKYHALVRRTLLSRLVVVGVVIIIASLIPEDSGVYWTVKVGIFVSVLLLVHTLEYAKDLRNSFQQQQNDEVRNIIERTLQSEEMQEWADSLKVWTYRNDRNENYKSYLFEGAETPLAIAARMFFNNSKVLESGELVRVYEEVGLNEFRSTETWVEVTFKVINRGTFHVTVTEPHTVASKL